MEIAQSPNVHNGQAPWTPAEFEKQLRAKGTAYHIHHPFNVRMNSGGCTADAGESPHAGCCAATLFCGVTPSMVTE